VISFTILGEPASKANSRKAATIGGRFAVIDGKRTRAGGKSTFIKSEKARDYERDALRQIPLSARQRVTGPVCITLRIYYATERPDLDESLILDILQDRYVRDKRTKERVLVQKGVYQNDRQVREKHVFWGKDTRNPRAEIEIEPIVPQQQALPVEPATVEEGDPF
jgi:Holliday junction resolvase RusA-like endonuclease